MKLQNQQKAKPAPQDMALVQEIYYAHNCAPTPPATMTRSGKKIVVGASHLSQNGVDLHCPTLPPQATMLVTSHNSLFIPKIHSCPHGDL